MMIAYSSVSHMGIVIGGIITCNSYGLCGFGSYAWSWIVFLLLYLIFFMSVDLAVVF